MKPLYVFVFLAVFMVAHLLLKWIPFTMKKMWAKKRLRLCLLWDEWILDREISDDFRANGIFLGTDAFHLVMSEFCAMNFIQRTTITEFEDGKTVERVFYRFPPIEAIPEHMKFPRMHHADVKNGKV